MRIYTSLILALLAMSSLVGNETQTIRGTITDADTKTSLIGANVILLDSDPQIGTITDPNGTFRLDKVPVGRVSLLVSYVGYKERVLLDLVIHSGKELVLDIELQESVQTLEEVVVMGRKKDEALNDMAMVSARQFTVEETGRYAGSLNDVARMASNYAGVSSANDSRNDIVIRGNSPSGLLWRFHGVDIPDPNHFSGLGSNGSPMSMLNYNVLANSDFMTGAFPAEYGNALSGVFDIKMREGNNEKREYMFQLGILGTEVMAEGPFKKDYNGSYLLNYRFSTTSILRQMGMDFGYAGEADYQDLTYNVKLPTKKGNSLSLFGIFGNSVYSAKAVDKDFDALDANSESYSDDRFRAMMYSFGASYLTRISSNTYIKTTAAITQELNEGDMDTINQETGDKYKIYQDESYAMNFSLNTYLAHRINAKNKVRFGVNLKHIMFDISMQNRDHENEMLQTIRENSGSTLLSQYYGQWKHLFTDNLQFTGGLFAQHLALNQSFSLEPRLGLKFDISNNQSINIGYGRHSQSHPLLIYFITTPVGEELVNTNKDLDFTKSDHYVLGYQVKLFDKVNLKVESYYQELFDAPTHRYDNPSSFSLLNEGGAYEITDEDSLANNGRGRNYGLELTLEKYFSKGYYYLITGSLYNSEYTGSDKVWRNTAFNGGYAVNFLAGKEWALKKNRVIALDVKVATAGGQRYTPVDEQASIDAGETVEIDEEAFTLQHDPYFRTDIKVSYRVNRPKVSHEFFINVDNVFNTQNFFRYRYNVAKQDFQYVYQLGLFPTFQYKIYF